jgi:hypothetical protein
VVALVAVLVMMLLLAMVAEELEAIEQHQVLQYRLASQLQ